MFVYLILGIALLAGLVLAGQWYVNASPKSLLRALKWALVVLILAVIVFFAATGKLLWAIATVPALLPWFFRIRQVARTARTFQRMAQATGGRAGKGHISSVETRFLAMELDHESGDISGTVREGPFAGRTLADLSAAERQALYRLYSADADSRRLLESYLDRYDPAWREQPSEQASHEPHDGGAMDRGQAFAILGLEEGASDERIREAHRRLIASLHPDRGGSGYLAAQINRAKDVLLG